MRECFDVDPRCKENSVRGDSPNATMSGLSNRSA